MQKYFLSANQIRNHQAEIMGPDFHHIRHVMRMKPKDIILISDEEGSTWTGEITAFTEATVLVNLLEKQKSIPALSVTIAQALIKKDAFELMIEKATEFGSCAIIPTFFSRTIIKIDDPSTLSKKTERYQTIAKEAAEQSHRDSVPKIFEPTKLKDLPFADFDRIWVCYEASKPEETLKAAIEQAAPTDKILILIGPEGGIEPAEITYLQSIGARIVDLGPRILRSETASLYVLSVLSYLWGR